MILCLEEEHWIVEDTVGLLRTLRVMVRILVVEGCKCFQAKIMKELYSIHSKEL